MVRFQILPMENSDYSGRFNADSENILFVGDPHLGRDRGWEIFAGFFPRARKLIWQKGTPKAPVHRQIQRRKWLFTISFYSDFIFAGNDFPHLGLPLNLHPSLPVLRGVGYDHIPLIENHREHGGTLHYMDPPPEPRLRISDGVDTGRIVRVRKRGLSPTATYGDIRAMNQRIVLEMLAELCGQLSNWGCVATAHRELCREADENGLNWSERYLDGPARERILEKLYCTNPGHRVFDRSLSMGDDAGADSADAAHGTPRLRFSSCAGAQ